MHRAMTDRDRRLERFKGIYAISMIFGYEFSEAANYKNKLIDAKI